MNMKEWEAEKAKVDDRREIAVSCIVDFLERQEEYLDQGGSYLPKVIATAHRIVGRRFPYPPKPLREVWFVDDQFGNFWCHLNSLARAEEEAKRIGGSVVRLREVEE